MGRDIWCPSFQTKQEVQEVFPERSDFAAGFPQRTDSVRQRTVLVRTLIAADSGTTVALVGVRDLGKISVVVAEFFVVAAVMY